MQGTLACSSTLGQPDINAPSETQVYCLDGASNRQVNGATSHLTDHQSALWLLFVGLRDARCRSRAPRVSVKGLIVAGPRVSIHPSLPKVRRTLRSVFVEEPWPASRLRNARTLTPDLSANVVWSRFFDRRNAFRFAPNFHSHSSIVRFCIPAPKGNIVPINMKNSHQEASFCPIQRDGLHRAHC